MTQNKAILVATVGTRDLAFYTESENKWLNIGNAYSSTLEESHKEIILKPFFMVFEVLKV
jgi:hypothetical protein